MTIDIELSGGPGDGQQFTIASELAPEWPPQAIYLPRFGNAAPIVGPLVGRSRIVANAYSLYGHRRRATADGRQVYEYEADGGDRAAGSTRSTRSEV
jgi:hypothetical protein